MQKSSFLYLLLICGIALLAAYHAFSQDLAPTVIVRLLALSAYFLLCVSLIIGPLVVFNLSLAPLIEPRRAVGLAAFVFAALHLLLVVGLYFNWQVLESVSGFPNLVAVPAAAILAALALTSSDWATAKMGLATWKLLHRLVYVAFVLITAHFVLLARGLSFSHLNLAEASLLALGAITVILQVAGFMKKREKKKE